MDEWIIEYSNDVGPYDDYFIEWWEATDGSTVFKCETERDAEWLCNKLNNS